MTTIPSQLDTIIGLLGQSPSGVPVAATEFPTSPALGQIAVLESGVWVARSEYWVGSRRTVSMPLWAGIQGGSGDKALLLPMLGETYFYGFAIYANVALTGTVFLPGLVSAGFSVQPFTPLSVGDPVRCVAGYYYVACTYAGTYSIVATVDFAPIVPFL